jgi:hypothetical protein
MVQREIGWSGMDWTNVAYNRYERLAVVNRVMTLRVP